MSVHKGTKMTSRRTSLVRRWKETILAGTLALSLAWTLPAMAVAPAQDAEPTPLPLGQMARGTLANGESVAFTFEAPEDATYVITTADDAEAEKFDLILVDESGEELYNDIFETAEFDLDDGLYTLELVAVDNGEYSLFVAGGFGDLSSNSNRPGDLYAGSFVIAEDVSGDQYATLEIPDSDFWQQVLVTMTGDEAATFSATVSDEDFTTYEYVSDSAIEGPLRFFTKGGVYDLAITPAQDGPLTVVVLTSGPAPSLAVGESVEGAVTLPSGESYYIVQPSGNGGQITVTLTSDSEDVDLDLSVSPVPGEDTNTSSQFGSNESVTVVPLGNDPLYVRVYAYDTSSIEESVPYTLQVEEGDAAATLAPGQSSWGVVEAGATNFHVLEVPEGNVFVTVYMHSNVDDDLDLSATATDAGGTNVASPSSSTLGSSEVIAAYVESPTTWLVKVNGAYVDETTPYVLLVHVQGADVLGGQWAVSAVASSEYGTDGYSATQATGEPDVEVASDNPNAWTSATSDDGEETLDLTFAQAVVPSGIDIYESFNPGAIVQIAALDPNSNEWVVMWEGEGATNQDFRTFSPELDAPDFATDQIRIVLDTSLVSGWNEIDAVMLYGMPAVE